jgi:hypothetical protein
MLRALTVPLVLSLVVASAAVSAACDPVKAGPGTPDAAGVNPDGGALPDSGGGPCTDSSQCSAPLGVCAADGVCVACAAASDCTAEPDAPVCDDQARACRGCTKDNECGVGGVCLEGTGRCVAGADAAFVTMNGSDSGTCTRAAPCAGIPYAITQLGARKTIHVLGGSLDTATLVLADVGTLAIDGEDTQLSAGSASTTLNVRGNSDVTIEGFRFNVPPTSPTGADVPAIVVTGSATKATLEGLDFGGSGGTAVSASLGATVVLSRSHVGSLSTNNTFEINSNGAKTTVVGNTLEMTIVSGANGGALTVARNRFESTRDGSVHAGGGVLVVQNNLIIHRDGYNDSISVSNLSPGSIIRFNTIVNTTATPLDGSAIYCDATVQVTSNVFAYNSGHPITGQGCATRYSVFDDVALTSAGTGNHVTGIETIFVDRMAGDYHLAAGSVARKAAEPGQDMVDVDFEGNARPNPTGTNADCGAFEAP